MTVTVRLFAILRERAGRDSIEVELEDGATVAEALDQLSSRPELGELLGRMHVQMAVNRDYADPDTTLSAGDELALVPPVSGGESERVHVRITDGPLSLESLAGLVPPRGRCDRHLPGHHARHLAAGLRGVPRDGGGANRRDPA